MLAAQAIGGDYDSWDKARLDFLYTQPAAVRRS
jgi:hypothetical protein